MSAISPRDSFTKTFVLPYQLGIYLAANAVADSLLVMDGLNCVMPKIDFLAGNHDLYSTLLSPEGRHRVVCTMTGPLPQEKNPEKKLAALLGGLAGSPGCGVVLLTGLPYMKITGMDYEGLAAGARGGAPVVDVPARSMEADWLDGYALSLDALARALPARKLKTRKRRVALVGYLLDRNERDHAANIAELRRLLRICGLEPACVFPSGGRFGELTRALEAEVVVSLPYGRQAAARIAGRTGASLVETGLPMGFQGTARWLEAVRRGAGLGGGLPREVREAERAEAALIAPALGALVRRNVVFAGDPHLFAAFAAFAAELGMRVRAGLIDSARRPLDTSRLPETVLFSPDVSDAAAALKRLTGYSRPDLVVGNSFAAGEDLAAGAPFTELGFPSYGHHCLNDEPYLGFAGARTLAGRLLNGLNSAADRSSPG